MEGKQKPLESTEAYKEYLIDQYNSFSYLVRGALTGLLIELQNCEISWDKVGVFKVESDEDLTSSEEYSDVDMELEFNIEEVFKKRLDVENNVANELKKLKFENDMLKGVLNYNHKVFNKKNLKMVEVILKDKNIVDTIEEEFSKFQTLTEEINMTTFIEELDTRMTDLKKESDELQELLSNYLRLNEQLINLIKDIQENPCMIDGDKHEFISFSLKMQIRIDQLENYARSVISGHTSYMIQHVDSFESLKSYIEKLQKDSFEVEVKVAALWPKRCLNKNDRILKKQIHELINRHTEIKSFIDVLRESFDKENNNCDIQLKIEKPRIDLIKSIMMKQIETMKNLKMSALSYKFEVVNLDVVPEAGAKALNLIDSMELQKLHKELKSLQLHFKKPNNDSETSE